MNNTNLLEKIHELSTCEDILADWNIIKDSSGNTYFICRLYHWRTIKDFKEQFEIKELETLGITELLDKNILVWTK